jgi:hypothetical protein
LFWDGFGFHEGFFRPGRSIRARVRPPLAGYARRAFDQGLGRSLWFVEGASPSRIAATITAFEAPRQPDLWSGVGLACGYAGARDEDVVTALVTEAARHQDHLRQGVAFAAAARRRAGNICPDTARACEIVCGASPSAVACMVDQSLAHASTQSDHEGPYEAWRARVRRQFAQPQES